MKKLKIKNGDNVEVITGDDDRSSYSGDSSDNEDPTTKETTAEEQEQQDPASRISYLTALSRGQIDVSSSSSEEDDSDNDEESSQSSVEESDHDMDDTEEKVGILDPSFQEAEVEITHDESPYLAVMNMDWTHVRAVDIYALLSSFVTPIGSVKRVRVFPSDFGLERMKQEDEHGPKGLWKSQKVKDVMAMCSQRPSHTPLLS